MVCCHGVPGLWDYLGDLGDLLDESHLVVRSDQRGCGRSTGPDGPFTAVACLAGVGAASGWREPYIVERNRRLSAELPRWQQLGSRIRTPAEEREWCLLQWRPDFSPCGDAEGHAAALWRTRPHGNRGKRAGQLRAHRRRRQAGPAPGGATC